MEHFVEIGVGQFDKLSLVSILIQIRYGNEPKVSKAESKEDKSWSEYVKAVDAHSAVAHEFQEV